MVVGRALAGSRIDVAGFAATFDRRLNTDGVTELNSLVVGGVCAVHQRSGCLRVKVAQVVSRGVGVFAFVDWQDDLDWAAEVNNLDAVAHLSRQARLNRNELR